jgi:hypothetical protein
MEKSTSKVPNKTVCKKINSNHAGVDVNYINCSRSRSLIRAQNNVSCWSLLEMLLDRLFCDSKEFMEQVSVG